MNLLCASSMDKPDHFEVRQGEEIMRKLFGILALMALLASFSACGGGGGSTVGGTGPVTTPTLTAPIITTTAPVVATEGQTFTYTAGATGSAPLSFSFTGLPAWLSASANQISGVPAVTDVGTTGTITLTVSNGTLPNATQSFAITVLSSTAGQSAVETSFLLTDAPVDDLSVFQVEITRVDIQDTSNTVTNVFPQVANSTMVVNLLDLQGINNLLANVGLNPGTYDEIELDFINASAVDINANALTVLPQTSGSVTIELNPAVVVTSTSATVQIDFDVNSSISNLVIGVGGSLTLNPTVFATQQGTGSIAVHEIRGVASAVTTTGLTLDANGSTLAVSIDASTTVEDANGSIHTNVADLTTLVNANDSVSVSGQLDSASASITASEIEVKGNATTIGTRKEVRGIVTSVGSGTFDLYVRDARQSGLAVGSVQTVTTTAGTVFSYDDPAASATFANLNAGQSVRVFGSSTSALDAGRVTLRDTDINGTIASIDTTALTAAMTVASVRRVAVSVITGLSNPVTLQFTGSIPAQVTVGRVISVEGDFNRTTPGVFNVKAGEVEVEDNGEAEIEGGTYSIVTSSPLVLSVTGKGEGITGTAPFTVNVAMASNVVILERDKSTNTTRTISQADVIAGINLPRYKSISAEGAYDAGTNTITATKIRADIGQPGTGGDAELEGTSYTLTSSNPLVFDLTGNGASLGLVGSVTVSVVLGQNVVIAQKDKATRQLVTLPQADFEAGIIAGTWGELEAKGSFDAASNTLTATFIKVEAAEGPEGGDEGEGTSYTLTTSSPLAYSIVLAAGNLGATEVTTPVTVDVVLGANATLLLRNDAQGSSYNPISETELATGIGAGTYDEVKIVGSYDSASNTFTASEIKVRIK